MVNCQTYIPSSPTHLPVVIGRGWGGWGGEEQNQKTEKQMLSLPEVKSKDSLCYWWLPFGSYSAACVGLEERGGRQAWPTASTTQAYGAVLVKAFKCTLNSEYSLVKHPSVIHPPSAVERLPHFSSECPIYRFSYLKQSGHYPNSKVVFALMEATWRVCCPC